jgi:hypothetical protein
VSMKRMEERRALWRSAHDESAPYFPACAEK